MPEEDVVKRARDLVARAGPGPWFWKHSYEIGDRVHWALSNAESEKDGRILDASLVLYLTHAKWLGRKCEDMPNWQLIAAAPELLTALCDEVERLRGLMSGMSFPVGD